MGPAARTGVGIASAAGGFAIILGLWAATAPARTSASLRAGAAAPSPGAPPPTPATLPAPPASIRHELTELERLCRERAYAAAGYRYDRIVCAMDVDPKSGEGIIARAHAAALRDLCMAFADVDRLRTAGDFLGAIRRLDALTDFLRDVPEERGRSDWARLVTETRTESSDLYNQKIAYDTMVNGWPDPPQLPEALMGQTVFVLLGRRETEFGKRAHAFVSDRLSRLLDHADASWQAGRKPEAVRIYTFAGGFPESPEWSPRARAGLDRAAKDAQGVPAVTNAGPDGSKPPKPLPSTPAAPPPETMPSIRLPVTPSDFEVTPDGKHLVALNSAGGEALVYSLPDGKEAARVSVLDGPLGVVAVGRRVWIVGQQQSVIEVIDAGTWKVERRLALLSKGALGIAASPLAVPPRVWVVTSAHLHEFDAETLELRNAMDVNFVAHGSIERFNAHPYGHVVLFGSGYGNFGVYQPGDASRAATQGGQSVPDFDGQGQYAVASDGLFDAAVSGSIAPLKIPPVRAGHPQLPYVITYDPGTERLGAVDLYRRGVVKGVDYAGRFPSLRGRSEAEMKMVLRPDTPGVLIGRISTRGRVADPTDLYLAPLPLADVTGYPGYFAFTAVPPRTAAPGLTWKYTVRLSPPHQSRAKVTVLRLPKSMAWDEASRTLSWRPTMDDIGSVDFAVRAADPEGGLEIQQDVKVTVSLRTVRATTVSPDGRYIYGVSGTPPRALVHDLQEDREYTFVIEGPTELLAPMGGRLYYLRSDVPRVHSVKLPDGSDPKEHDLEGWIPRYLTGDGEGNLHVVVEEGPQKFHAVRLHGQKKTRMLTHDRQFKIHVADDGRKALISASVGGTYDLFCVQEDQWKVLKPLGLTIYGDGPVMFSSDGAYLFGGDGLYEVKTVKKVVEIEGMYGYDVTGPYFAVAEEKGIGLFHVPQKTKYKTISYPKTEGGYELRGRPFPLSQRGLILLATGEGMILIPTRF